MTFFGHKADPQKAYPQGSPGAQSATMKEGAAQVNTPVEIKLLWFLLLRLTFWISLYAVSPLEGVILHSNISECLSSVNMVSKQMKHTPLWASLAAEIEKDFAEFLKSVLHP